MRTITYGEDASQVADLHLPDGADAPQPVVVLLHGGFWLARYGRDIVVPLARDLAGRGYAVWNVEYRRIRHHGGGWPGTFEDVAAAVDHLATLGEQHVLDLDRVAAVGHSAGGQLAVWAAARPGLPDGAPGAGPSVPLRAAISLSGVLDLAAAADLGLGGRSVGRLLGGSPRALPERYELASPLERVPVGVPVVAIHGEDDDVVPPGQSRAFVEAAVGAGDPAELVLLPAVGHFQAMDPTSVAWRAAVDRLPELLA